MQENKKEKQHFIKKIKERFNIDHIKNQHHYIKNMNKFLQIKLTVFSTDPNFHHLNPSEIRQHLALIPFFLTQKHQATLNYPHQETTIIITGIMKQYVEIFVKEYKQSIAIGYQSQRNFKIQSFRQTSFWQTIQLSSVEAAKNFQKFVRNKKRQLDYEGNIEYKIGKKRVRIIIQNEDLFTILTDIMNEEQSKRFTNSLVKKEEFRGLQYFPFYMGTNNHTKNQQQVEDSLSEEFRSRSSDIYDGSKINEIIETKNQGIQYEKIQAQQEQQSIGKRQCEQKTKYEVYAQTEQKQNLYVKCEEVDIEKQPQIQQKTEIQMYKKQKLQKQQTPNKLQQQQPQPQIKIQKQQQQQLVKKYCLIQVKKKYEDYKRKNGKVEYDLPQFIKKQPQWLMYKKKFHESVINAGKKNRKFDN